MSKFKLPDRWLPYKALGQQIPGTRFICFKVPLRDSAFHGMEDDIRFTPEMLLEQCPTLKFIVDLTNTDRYYDGTVFSDRGLIYKKIQTPGHAIPEEHYVKEFFDTVDSFLGMPAEPELVSPVDEDLISGVVRKTEISDKVVDGLESDKLRNTEGTGQVIDDPKSGVKRKTEDTGKAIDDPKSGKLRKTECTGQLIDDPKSSEKTKLEDTDKVIDDLKSGVKRKTEDTGKAIDDPKSGKLRKTECTGQLIDDPKSGEKTKLEDTDKVIDDLKSGVKRKTVDSLIGVHCTHGLNRTSYYICSYMIHRMGYEPQDAITAFEEARGHKIERPLYVEDLLKRGKGTRDTVAVRGGRRPGPYDRPRGHPGRSGPQPLLPYINPYARPLRRPHCPYPPDKPDWRTECSPSTDSHFGYGDWRSERRHPPGYHPPPSASYREYRSHWDAGYSNGPRRPAIQQHQPHSYWPASRARTRHPPGRGRGTGQP